MIDIPVERLLVKIGSLLMLNEHLEQQCHIAAEKMSELQTENSLLKQMVEELKPNGGLEQADHS